MRVENPQTLVAGLVATHGNQLRRFLVARVRNAADVPDLVQEIYLRMLRVPDIESVRSPEAYLFTVAQHVIYQHTLSQYSFWGGSVQLMPNENYVAGLSATTLGSRAEEFAGDSSQAPVWQMDVIGQNPDMYRSLRLPSLYPGVTWP